MPGRAWARDEEDRGMKWLMYLLLVGLVVGVIVMVVRKQGSSV